MAEIFFFTGIIFLMSPPFYQFNALVGFVQATTHLAQFLSFEIKMQIVNELL